jgi:hypothetical protein
MKRCPFCLENRYLSAVDFTREFGDTKLPKPWHVHCVHCDTFGPGADTATEAERLWNLRSDGVCPCNLPDDAKD